MLAKRVVEAFEHNVRRRRFLVGTSGAAFGLLLAMLGLPTPPAEAGNFACCNLVYPDWCSSPSCANYMWSCCDASSGNIAYYCYECYQLPPQYTCSCNSNGCSYAEQTQFTC